MRAITMQEKRSLDITYMLSDACGHVPLALAAVPNARVLWVNPRIAAYDKNFTACSGDLSAHSQHLLAQCAYALSVNAGVKSQKVIGFVDRYGGIGIGSNGGSGRAAAINGYYVKGIGPTPLVGKNTNPAHATGHCTLEECIREAVLSECVAAEFPWGAVPVLAIIGTGVSIPKSPEPGIGLDDPEGTMELALLVRPSFLRPAHFDRALGFLSDRPKQGFADALRVKTMVAKARDWWGDSGFLNALMQLHSRWADQLAYGYVHRFCHGAPSPSNVTLDGRLLDFGAATLPTWARAHTALGGPVAGQELPFMLQALQSMLRQIRHQCPDLGISDGIMSTMAQVAAQSYGRTLAVELLRVLGLQRQQAVRVLQRDHNRGVQTGLNRLLMHYASEYFNTYESTPQPRIAWRLPEFWEGSLDAVAPGLRDLLHQCILADSSSNTAHVLSDICERNAQIAKTRPMLFRENLRRSILDFLQHTQKTQTLNRMTLDAFIREQVHANALLKDVA